MVLRFTPGQDKELMRELIRLKPFAAARGSTLHVWGDVAACLSTALGVQVNVKQVRDRLTLLKGLFKDAEAAAARGSGIEESVDAVNVQSHNDERGGLVREYIALEDHFKAEKAAKKSKKQQKDEHLALCAEELVRESTRRRAFRVESEAELPASDCSVAESTASGVSAQSSASTRPPRSTPKRTNAFLQEVQRQEKRQRQELSLNEQELLQSQQQFQQRLSFERERDEQRLHFQERMQKINHDLIIECAKLFSAAIARNDS